MNPFYNIWNYDYIQQQAQMQHHFSQVKTQRRHCLIF